VFRNRARNLLVALSIVAAVGSSLAGSPAASAAPVPAPAAVSNVQLDASQTSGHWTMDFNKMTITPHAISHQPNRQTVYGLKVKAEKGDLQDVMIWHTSHYKNIINDTGAGFAITQVTHVNHLPENSHVIVVVECNPPAGKYCDFAHAAAMSPNILGSPAGIHTEDGKKS
jgi:hypothetical protein